MIIDTPGVARLNYFDVVVVGAGFSGLSASKKLGEIGVHTLVIEQNPAVGIPVRTSGGTWFYEMLKLGVPREFLYEVEELRFFLNEEELGHYVGVHDKGAILKVREYLQWLSEELPFPTVSLSLKTKLLDIIQDKEELILKTDKGSVRTKFLIDCSGSWAFAARRFGFIRSWERYAIGAEYEIYIGKELRTSAILMGSKYVKSGYAWLFPIGKRVRIGVGSIRPFSNDNPMEIIDRVVATLRKLLLKDVPAFNPVELHAGIYPCQGMVNPLIIRNIILAGDAGSLGSPLIGEGIRYAILTGMKAAEAVSRAYSKNDPSTLKEYEVWIESNLKKDFELALKIQTLAATSNDDEIKKYVKTFNYLYQRYPRLAEEFFKTRLLDVINYLSKDMRLSDLVRLYLR